MTIFLAVAFIVIVYGIILRLIAIVLSLAIRAIARSL